jgi:hypothetical protein
LRERDVPDPAILPSLCLMQRLYDADRTLTSNMQSSRSGPSFTPARRQIASTASSCCRSAAKWLVERSIANSNETICIRLGSTAFCALGFNPRGARSFVARVLPADLTGRGKGALRSNKAPNLLRQGIVQLQQTLAVRWAIEINRNLSQSISLLYPLTAGSESSNPDSADVDAILAPIRYARHVTVVLGRFKLSGGEVVPSLGLALRASATLIRLSGSAPTPPRN